MNSKSEMNPLQDAIKRRDLDTFHALLETGADIRYVDENGYDALIDASSAFYIDDKLIDVLGMLIDLGASVSAVSSYGESAVGRLSLGARFEAVKFLLDAGSDPNLVGLTPLMRAVAFGSVEEVEAAIKSGNDLEERDRWGRTAWLIAVQIGDTAKAGLLMQSGADVHAGAFLGRPSTFFAVESKGSGMLAWLLDQGFDIGPKAESGETLLCEAVQQGNADCVDLLVGAGADVNEKGSVSTPLWYASTKRIAMTLLEAGADPNGLTLEGRRAILGYEPEPNEEALNVSPADFQKHRTPRFGKSNPEKIINPFWEAMIRSGVNAYRAQMHLNGGKTCWNFDDPSWFTDRHRRATWCADRFGQSITFLPDGRIVQVAGEHEDFGDPDFCIYNDVFIHSADGSITIYGYSEDLFPPTDFHTATLAGDYIYLIGSVGYPDARGFRFTPVYRLHIVDFHIERLETSGEPPGWIGRHQAKLVKPHEISVTGGKVIVRNGDHEEFLDNHESFVLDVGTLEWRRG